MPTDVVLQRSNKPDKKWMVRISQPSGRCKTIHFGADQMSDYTIHKNHERKQRYIDRHKKNENWTKSGINTAGFWSRWLLWGETTVRSSKQSIARRFDIQFRRPGPTPVRRRSAAKPRK